MQRLFPGFPPGIAGFGLLLLRICAVTTLLLRALAASDAPGQQICCGVFAAGLLVGSWTPIWGVLSLGLLVGLAHAQVWPSSLQFWSDMVEIAAIVCLGPGAYSVDALRFGRRLVVLPDGRS